MNDVKVPRGWSVAAVGELASVDNAKDNGTSAELPYIGLENIEAGSGEILRDLPVVPKPAGAFLFDERHVLYGKLRPYLNKVALPDFRGRCSTEAIPILCGKALDRRYLAAFLRRPATVEAVMKHKIGSRMPRADMSVVLGLQLPLPPIGEQRRIADKLDEAMAEVALARGAVAAQRRDCRNAWFEAINVALGGRAIAAAGDAGSGWMPLTDVARLESGHTPSRRRPEWWGGDIPWIALPDIRSLDGTTAFTTGETTNELGLANSSARLLPQGTVVLSRTASVGFVTVMGRPMATSQDFVNWVPGPKVRPWFLAYALIGARTYLRGLSSGAVHKTIYMPTLKALHIRLPTLREQDRVLEQITTAHEILGVANTALDHQAAAIGALPPALLSVAFTGEL